MRHHARYAHVVARVIASKIAPVSLTEHSRKQGIAQPYRNALAAVHITTAEHQFATRAPRGGSEISDVDAMPRRAT